MNQNNWQNTSQFYSQSHKHFYRWIIYPTVVLFLFILLFLFFGKKEIIIKSQAQITSDLVSKIQIPIESKIIENKLSENLSVKKGEALVKLDIESLKQQKSSLEKEIPLVQNQILANQTFIDSLKQGKSLFTSDDDFGYSNQLQSLLSENTASDYAFKQSIIDHESEKSTYENSKNSIQKSISKKQVEKNDWEKIKSAWSSQSNLSGASEDTTSQYLNFQEQLKASSKEEKEQVKVTISSSINDKISQIDQELEQLEMEQSKLTPPASYDNEKSSQEYKKKQLVEQTIATAKQKSIEFKEAQEKYNLELQEVNKQIQDEIITSPIDGFVHINYNVKDQKIIPKGEVIAEIYPEIKPGKIEFTSQIEASDLTQVKSGMRVHFKLDSKGNSPIIMEGKIKEISANAETSERGSFYIVKGFLKQTNKTPFNSRYGLNGRLSLIVGKKSYFNVLKEMIIKN